VVEVDEPRVEVRLGSRIPPALDHLEVGGERLVPAALALHLLALAEVRIVHLGRERGIIAAAARQGGQREERDRAEDERW
jgi:hypothetical protein